MPVGCVNCAFVLFSAVTLLLGSASRYYLRSNKNDPELEELFTPPIEIATQYQSFDVIPGEIILLVLAAVCLFENIHKKLMDRRILKRREVLSAATARLRAAEQQKAQLEGQLRLARGAATEYNLLLYLLLRQRQTANNRRR